MVHLGKIEHPLLDQMDAYREMQQELESKYAGRWVVIDNGKLVGNYKTFKDASADARKKELNPLNCLVKQVGIDPKPLSLIIPSEWKIDRRG